MEVVASTSFQLFVKDRLATHWRVDPTADILRIDEESIEQFKIEYFDTDLGWVFKPTTTSIRYTTFDERGARRSLEAPQSVGRWLAAYGDSFTFGEDVADDQTWPAYLSKILGLPVDNYGVAGYGPDQALLRLERHLKAGRKPAAAILGILSENIARVVNVYRHYYITTSEVMNFKPTLIVNEDKSTWAANPLRKLDNRESLLAAVSAADATDFWATYNEQRPEPGFPHLISALDTFHYLVFRVRRWQDLWQLDAPRTRLRGVIDRFVETSTTNGLQPVVLMIPMGLDLRARDNGEDWTYRGLVTQLREDYAVGDLTVIDPLEHDFASARFNLQPFAGHASPYGNRILAEITARYFDILR